jgi:photosystem II stability/assembly factor-like uncharacterized protein
MKTKYISLCLSLLLSLICTDSLFAQWMALPSGTNNNLLSISFLNPNYGMVGGENGTLLLTVNGGTNWTSLNPLTSASIEDVCIVNIDTFLISYNENSVTHLNITTDAGLTWNNIADDSVCYRSINSAINNAGKWFSIGNTLRSSVDHGSNWDTLFNYSCGTLDLNRIKFSGDQYMMIGGNQSGFVTYSASLIRSEDFGISFLPLDPFSFPNADYLTAFSSPFADTSFFFLNHYNGFMPGTTNSLYKAFNFHVQTTGTSYYDFSTSPVNTSLPTYMNDGHYFSSEFAIAAGNDGNVYESTDGGQNWLNTYAGIGPIRRFAIAGEQTAFAIGDSGQILKNDQLNTVNSIEKINCRIWPNPASSEVMLSGLPKNKDYSFSIYTNKMQNILSGQLARDGRVDISGLINGSYFIRIDDGESDAVFPLVIIR